MFGKVVCFVSKEIIYKSAENLEVNTDSLQIYRRQAKDALWYATMQKLGRDSEALCSYENTCVKTFWWTAEKCHVTDSLEITVEKPTGLTESKARCNILPLGFSRSPGKAGQTRGSF